MYNQLHHQLLLADRVSNGATVCMCPMGYNVSDDKDEETCMKYIMLGTIQENYGWYLIDQRQKYQLDAAFISFFHWVLL